METRKLGGVDIPALGQGTWNMERDAKGSIAALRRGVELGLTHVDTAEMYGSGRVEEIVGEALAGIRDRVYLVSKVLPTNASRKGTVEACERSLKRLRTDTLDLYLLHWPGEHPLEDTIAEDMFGFYAEAGYDVLPWLIADTRQSLAPFFRYEIFDTQDKVPEGFQRVPGKNVQLYTVGLSYKPLPQVVVKFDYRNFDAGHVAPRADEINLGAGFVF